MNSCFTKRKKTCMMLFLIVSVVCMMSTNVLAASVAKIGAKKYKTVQSAVNAAKDGQTVKILKAVSTSKPVTVSKKNITIDFAKKKYTFRSAKGDAFQLKSGSLTFRNMNLVSKCNAVNVGSGAKLTILSGSSTGCITNRGTLLVKNGKFQGAGSGYDEEDYSIDFPAIMNYGSLTVLKGTFTGNNRPLIINYSQAFIKGGNYNATGLLSYNLKNQGGSDCVMVIKGGKFKGEIFNECSGHGQLLVLGGTFTAEKKQKALTNYNGRVLIAGGTFSGTDSNVVLNHFDDEIYVGGTMIITGGSFKSTGMWGTVATESEMIITGGTFLVNGETKGAIRLYPLDDRSVCYTSSSLKLTVDVIE